MSDSAIPFRYCQCGCGGKTSIAKQSDTRKGWVNGQPLRYLPGHHHRLRAERSEATMAKRFWPKVDQGGGPDACWPWKGALHHGYGKFGTTRQRGPMQAHRVAYELAHGPIPGGMVVCHSCDNRACCNPAHLWVGTVAENNADMRQKGRDSHGPQHGEAIRRRHPRGEQWESAKMTDDQVRAIRQLHASGLWSLNRLASLFNIGRAAVSAAVHRETWTHIE